MQNRDLELQQLNNEINQQSAELLRQLNEYKSRSDKEIVIQLCAMGEEITNEANKYSSSSLHEMQQVNDCLKRCWTYFETAKNNLQKFYPNHSGFGCTPPGLSNLVLLGILGQSLINTSHEPSMKLGLRFLAFSIVAIAALPFSVNGGGVYSNSDVDPKNLLPFLLDIIGIKTGLLEGITFFLNGTLPASYRSRTKTNNQVSDNPQALAQELKKELVTVKTTRIVEVKSSTQKNKLSNIQESEPRNTPTPKI